jgi:lipopolysaccharide transport system ATP-binding protein
VLLKKEWRKDPERFDLKNDGISETTTAIENASDGHDQIETVKQKESNQNSFWSPELLPKSTVYYEKRGAVIEKPHITTLDGRQVNMLVKGEKYIYTYSVHFDKSACNVRFGMMIKTISGYELAGALSAPYGEGIDYVKPHSSIQLRYQFHCKLNPGVYFLNAGVTAIENNKEVFLDRNIDIAMFRVQEEDSSISPLVVDLIENIEISVS